MVAVPRTTAYRASGAVPAEARAPSQPIMSLRAARVGIAQTRPGTARLCRGEWQCFAALPVLRDLPCAPSVQVGDLRSCRSSATQVTSVFWVMPMSTSTTCRPSRRASTRRRSVNRWSRASRLSRARRGWVVARRSLPVAGRRDLLLRVEDSHVRVPQLLYLLLYVGPCRAGCATTSKRRSRSGRPLALSLVLGLGAGARVGCGDLELVEGVRTASSWWRIGQTAS
jgi:hypothetical protein